MPELPEIALYLHALRERVAGERIERVRVRSPAVLKSVAPPVEEVHGKTVEGVRRIGKRVVLCLQDEFFVVVHLMVGGRFRWTAPGAAIPKKLGHAAFDFASGSLLLTEAGARKRVSLHVVRGEAALGLHDPGGIDPLEASFDTFARAVRRENRTLKRALTDPRILSGIGNAHSDEILFRARLSPVRLSRSLDDAEMARLRSAVRESLGEWSARLVAEADGRFPSKITAFHPAMSVHGKYGEPCPRCRTPVQRIVYAARETNYCPACQTGGRLLADRALSTLLRKDWPKTVEELEALRRAHSGDGSSGPVPCSCTSGTNRTSSAKRPAGRYVK